MRKYNLIPKFDSRKSFYGKAVVSVDAGSIKLYSYNTLVVEIKNNVPKVYGTYSQTTLRHIKEFLRQHGFTAETKSQIVRDYMSREKVRKVL